MKIRHTLLITPLLASCVLAGCNGNDSPRFINSALGTWRTNCQNNGVNSDYSRVTLNVDEATFNFDNEFFTDPRCTKPTVRYVSGGTLTQHERLNVSTGQLGARIDFLISNINVVTLDNDSVEQFNAAAFCGRTDWTPGVDVDVSNCPNVANSTVPRTEYDIYQITPESVANAGVDILYTGQVRALVESERPLQADLSTPYYRVENQDE